MTTRTKHPVVLIHGVLGYGRRRPLWGAWAPYWPEAALAALEANHLIVDVGALSSDHDRACEAFYQLWGGTVDYGEAHAREHGHARFGATYERPLHPQWSADKPVHLVGHSFGATTALELYQLLCVDAFGVGSDSTWVRSLVSIAGPLSGSTLTHVFGLHDGKMVARTLGHAIGAGLCLYHRLHTVVPWLRHVFDYRMPQWALPGASFREALLPSCRILASADLAVYDILPARRLARNARLVHMDKPYLVSIVTAPAAHSSTIMPILRYGLAVGLGVGLVLGALASLSLRRYLLALALVLGVQFLRLRQTLDYASLPCLTFLQVQMDWCVRRLHQIFDGFDRDEWGPNDGVVNVSSMLRPRTVSSAITSMLDQCVTFESEDESSAETASTTSSISSPCSPLSIEESLDDPFQIDPAVAKIQRGRWYVHRVPKNHLAGTHFDADAPALYARLLALLAGSCEG